MRKMTTTTRMKITVPARMNMVSSFRLLVVVSSWRCTPREGIGDFSRLGLIEPVEGERIASGVSEAELNALVRGAANDVVANA